MALGWWATPRDNNNNNNNNNNNHFYTRDAPFTHVEWIDSVRASSPFTGGNVFLKSFLFSPYPAIPPYFVKTLHPGIRPTKNTYPLRNYSCTQE